MTITRLRIDNINYYWRHDIPAFLLFLFDRENSYLMGDKTDEDEELDTEASCFRIGFRETANNILSNLNNYGYNLHFFADFYGSLYPELSKNSIEYTKLLLTEENVSKSLDEDEIDRLTLKHLSNFEDVGRVNEIKDFVKLIRYFIALEKSPEAYSVKDFGLLKLSDGKTYKIDDKSYIYRKECSHASGKIDFEAVLEYASSSILRLPPWISIVADLFDGEYYRICPEFMSLFHLHCVLEAADFDEEVELEIAVDAGYDFQLGLDGFLAQLSNKLVRKVETYNKAFEPLFWQEENLRARYVKSECNNLLKSCSQGSKYSKGLILERLIELLFTDNNSIDLVSKRVHTGDEEIDLVVKNTISSPFWQAFNSPLFFVECKNWSEPVGAKEARDFESKIRNHSKLAKIGFFVSLNGFTSGVSSELKRCSREDYHIVTLSRVEIEEFLKTDKLFYKWLENVIAESFC